MVLSKTDKSKLLSIARASIEATLGGSSETPNPGLEVPADSALLTPCGAFVTLKKKEELRGCIGRFTSNSPLAQVVTEMASAAATKDSRFFPVSAEELSDIEIEISVLTPMKKVLDFREIKVGRDGLCVVSGGMQGVLLPQVATEHNLDRESFLDETCIKAGLPASSWREVKVEVFSFQAVIINEDFND